MFFSDLCISVHCSYSFILTTLPDRNKYISCLHIEDLCFRVILKMPSAMIIQCRQHLSSCISNPRGYTLKCNLRLNSKQKEAVPRISFHVSKITWNDSFHPCLHFSHIFNVSANFPVISCVHTHSIYVRFSRLSIVQMFSMYLYEIMWLVFKWLDWKNKQQTYLPMQVNLR